MTAFRKSTFALLTILLIVGGQLFGVGFGYICNCHDQPLVTFYGHCHDDPHGSHDESDDSHHHDHDHQHGDEAPVSTTGHDHEPNRTELEASPLAKSPTAPAPVFAVLDADHFLIVLPTLDASIREISTFTYHEPSRPPLSTAQQVTHCTVILV